VTREEQRYRTADVGPNRVSQLGHRRRAEPYSFSESVSSTPPTRSAHTL